MMYDITMGLSQRQVYCDMLCASAEKQKPENLLLNDYARILCVSTWKKVAATMLSPAMIFRLRKINKEYDIIHIHHPDPMACLALFLSGYKGPVVLHWHSDILKQKMLLKALFTITKLVASKSKSNCWHHPRLCTGISVFGKHTAQSYQCSYRNR